MLDWYDLPIRDRYDWIKRYLDEGVTEIPEMRRLYSEGGYTPSKEIEDYIKNTEGFRSKWYKDGNGVDTVGYGFTGDYFKEKYPDGITKEGADKEFKRILGNFADSVRRNTPNYDKLSRNQKDALLSYMYNVGPGNYTVKSPKMQEAMRNQDWESVARHMDIGYNDDKNPGLRKRRDYEREMFLRGLNGNKSGVDFTQPVHPSYWYDEYMKSIGAAPKIPEAMEYRDEERLFQSNSPLSSMDLPDMITPFIGRGRNIERVNEISRPEIVTDNKLLSDMHLRLAEYDDENDFILQS